MARPDSAFILGAGIGTRLRPYTDTVPKPMVKVGRKSIIHRALEKLAQADVKNVVVNTHHLANIIEEHLTQISSPNIMISREEDLLDTGGGIKHALHHFKDDFYIINGDALWEDGNIPALQRLSNAWDGEAMDILLLLQPVTGMTLTHGVGDYNINKNGRAVRAIQRDGDYMFSGIRIASPRIFEQTPDGAFSFLTLMDKAEKDGRLYAIAHDHAWHHISTPEELHAVDAYLKKNEQA